MTLLSAAGIAAARSALEVLLVHRCTVRTMRAGAEDQHYDATTALGDPVTDVPCNFSTVGRVTRDIDGATTISGPTLIASATGPIRVGVQIANVTDQLGTVIAAGPLRVERVLDDTAGLGAGLLPQFELRAADAELSS